MATYTPNPDDATKPLDGDDASFMGAELRAIKARMTTMITGTFFPAGGTADAMTGDLPLLANQLRVSCVPVGANTTTTPQLNGIPVVKYNAAGAVVPLAVGDYNSLTAYVFIYLATGYAGAPCWILNINSESSSSTIVPVGATLYLAKIGNAV